MKPAVAVLMPALLCILAPGRADARLSVVASFSVLGDMVRQVAGERAEVRTLVGPNGDAHAFEPSPSDAASLAKADLVIVNGLGLEKWMERLVAAAGYM